MSSIRDGSCSGGRLRRVAELPDLQHLRWQDLDWPSHHPCRLELLCAPRIRKSPAPPATAAWLIIIIPGSPQGLPGIVEGCPGPGDDLGHRGLLPPSDRASPGNAC